MSVTVNDLLESMRNPNGRFAALDGVYAIVDRSGDPLMRVMRDGVVFEVLYRGAEYILECPLSGEFAAIGDAGGGCGHISHTTIFSNEMLVVDSMGVESYIDVALQRKPLGESLTAFIDRAAGSLRRDELGWIFGALCDFYLEVGLETGTRRSIKLADMYISLSQDGAYRVILANHLAIRGLGGRHINSELLAATLEIFMFCCGKGSYELFSGSYSFRHVNICRFLERSTAGEGIPAMQPFFSLLPLAIRPEYGEVDRGYVRENIERLRLLQTSGWVFGVDDSQGESMAVDKVLSDVTRYSRVGSVVQGLACVCREGRWSYIDEDGAMAFDSIFDGASDFAADRAVVWLNGHAGLIDIGGRFVMPPENEDICWDADDGVARVLRGGSFALFDSGGSPLTGFDYDTVEQASCGLMLAQREGMYGYLSVRGEVAIDFIYDAAYSFAEGAAQVDYMGGCYDIDTSGRRI